MPYHYTDEKRESDPQALPDIETEMTGGYWWYRFFAVTDGIRRPLQWNGRIHFGAFDTEAEALADARKGVDS